MVEQLLKKGASINLQDDADKQTPLHFGEENGCLKHASHCDKADFEGTSKWNR